MSFNETHPEADLPPLLGLARQAIGWHFDGRDVNAEGLYPRATAPQACFVSLKAMPGDRLRGCIGTLEPTKPTLEEEVVANSLAAATRDPRFEPLRPQELPGLRISIDLLSAPEAVESMAALDPERYGLIVRAGSRCGVLLPMLPGVDSAENQISICREKGRIKPNEPVSMERFTVERQSE